MNSDYFSDGYADQKMLEEIDAKLSELRHELTHGFDHTTGRSDSQIEEEIKALEKKRDELHLKLEHGEKTQQ